MNVFADIIKTLYGMFVADWRLTVATLTLVGGVGLLKHAGLSGRWSGLLLLVGSMAILVSTVLGTKRHEDDAGT